MTTMPDMYETGTFQGELGSGEERGWGQGDSAWETTLETTASASPSPPPAKPQRSFRQKREDAPETTAYLERCDHTAQEKEEDGMVMKGQKDEVAGDGAGGEAMTPGGGEPEPSSNGVPGDDGGRSSVSETDEERGDEAREEEGEIGDGREEEECQRAEEEKVSSGVGEGHGGNEEEEEKLSGGPSDDDSSESGRLSSLDSHEDGNIGEMEQEEQGSNSNEGVEQGETAPHRPRPARRSRVIRLYQYDDEGQRYGHLPDQVSDELGPAPKPKQRSLSLTRLNAIMAAATAGPLDTPAREEREGGRSPSPPPMSQKSPVFHMDI